MVTRARYVRSGESRDSSLVNEVIATLRARRKLIYIFMAAVFALSTVVLILTPNKYEASARIMPAMASQTGAAGAFAQSMGQGSQSLSSLMLSKVGSMATIIVELLKGRTVLDSVLLHRYTDVGGGREGDLFELWDVENTDLARMKLLSKASFSGDSKTGIVTISVETDYPNLSAQVCNEFVSQLDKYKRSLDATMADEMSRYLAEQVMLQNKAVEEAESKQENFFTANRNYLRADDPKLRLEVERHERNVMFQRQVLANLMELKVRSDMEREKEVPRISVLELAAPPVLKSGPQRVKSILMMTMFGFVFAVGLVALKLSYDTHFSQATKSVLADSYHSVGQDLRVITRRIKSPLHTVREPEA
ncbi:MAG: hypothetical protein KKG33_14880 [candidate division Zixibacteria bacterium]|nr:hypothetical protein [candidate division Zixibacteria bacterium]MBU1470279.1 hypothetical protein [candidate division Zixibacteria bacterium]MBU2626835.1 hypothetical protein [candidate division Zixibacteria bacterium]